MYDTIIIGAGPAGFTAGIYAARREMKTLIISREIGGQVVWATDIENYPGFKTVNNFELIQKMQEQVKLLGVEIKTAEIKKIDPSTGLGKEKYFTLYTDKDKYETRTVILAMGLAPRRLAIPGEQEFVGKGISYCANCDGPLFRGKTVAVVGGGNAAFDAAEVLSKIAAKVYLIHRRDEFKAFEALINEVRERENIELITNTEIKEISGEQVVKEIKLFNNKDNQESSLKVDGVFVEIGRIANTDLVADLAERNEAREIIVNEKCQTKTEGIFAAGDVTQVPFKQITIACGQGTIAALAAYQYLQLKAGKKADIVVDRSTMHKK